MADCINTVTIRVYVQENGIIRLADTGLYIGRLDGVSFAQISTASETVPTDHLQPGAVKVLVEAMEWIAECGTDYQSIHRAQAALAPFKCAPAPASPCITDKPTVTIPRNVQRHEDMSPKGVVRLFLQEDGDVVVEIAGREEHGEREKASAEFCSGGGGGMSPRTVEALKLLMAAMQADNDAGPGVRDYERKCYFDLRPEDQDWSK